MLHTKRIRPALQTASRGMENKAVIIQSLAPNFFQTQHAGRILFTGSATAAAFVRRKIKSEGREKSSAKDPWKLSGGCYHTGQKREKRHQKTWRQMKCHRTREDGNPLGMQN